jgi:hypothetical protein
MMNRLAIAAGSIAIAFATSGYAEPQGKLEAELREIDAQQRAAIAARDVRTMAALSHPNLTVNAPSNRVLTRADVLAMMRSGAIAAEQFERTPERVTITGNIAVVMGNERFVPTPASESGQMFGTKPLNRRYTNIYLRENGRWRFLARHANVVPRTAP